MTGRLIVKNGYLYGQINYKDNLGNYKKKLIPTGLKERGNRKEAQRILDEELKKYENPDYIVNEKPTTKNDIIFMDYV